MDVVCEEEQLFNVLAEEITAPISIDLPCRTKQLLAWGACWRQGWVSAGRNLFLPDMRFKPV